MVDNTRSRVLRWAASIQSCFFQIKRGGYLNPDPTWSSTSFWGWPPTQRWCEINLFLSQNIWNYFSHYPTIVLGALIIFIMVGTVLFLCVWFTTLRAPWFDWAVYEWAVFSRHTQIDPLMRVRTLRPSLLPGFDLLCLWVAQRSNMKPRDK